MQLKIEKLVYGGEGLAHHDGQTLFVPFVIPDEEVEAAPVERRKKFVRARLSKVLAPSPDRAAPPCPHFFACGGCHYQHIAYPAQARLKSEILRETLWRIGRVRWEGAIHEHPSPPLGYRNRAQWKIRLHGASESADKSSLAMGYFRAGSTALCPVRVCPILAPKLEECLEALRGLLAGGELPETLREIEAFTDEQNAKVSLTASLVNFPASPQALAEKLRKTVPGAESILLQETAREGMELFGPGYIQYRVGDFSYRVGHLSFFQVNRFLIDETVDLVVGSAQGRTALDLFAGVGLFSVALVKRFGRVVAVESNPAAARDLQENLQAASGAASGATQPVNANVEEFLSKATETPDLVVLDPPRTGVSATALQDLARLKPPRITYLSCDPSTLARDLAALTTSAYAIASVHILDVFPQSFHIESLVHLALGD